MSSGSNKVASLYLATSCGYNLEIKLTKCELSDTKKRHNALWIETGVLWDNLEILLVMGPWGLWPDHVVLGSIILTLEYTLHGFFKSVSDFLPFLTFSNKSEWNKCWDWSVTLFLILHFFLRPMSTLGKIVMSSIAMSFLSHLTCLTPPVFQRGLPRHHELMKSSFVFKGDLVLELSTTVCKCQYNSWW